MLLPPGGAVEISPLKKSPQNTRNIFVRRVCTVSWFHTSEATLASVKSYDITAWTKRHFSLMIQLPVRGWFHCFSNGDYKKNMRSHWCGCLGPIIKLINILKNNVCRAVKAFCVWCTTTQTSDMFDTRFKPLFYDKNGIKLNIWREICSFLVCCSRLTLEVRLLFRASSSAGMTQIHFTTC